jgi:hypothetical protein
MLRKRNDLFERRRVRNDLPNYSVGDVSSGGVSIADADGGRSSKKDS